MGLAALIPWLLIASGLMSRPDTGGLIRAEQEKQAALDQLAVARSDKEAAARSLEQAQEEVRRLRERLDQAAVEMANQTEAGEAREAELQQALAAQQELAESRLAMLKKSEGETAETKLTEKSDEPIEFQQTLVNSIGIELTFIRPGRFKIGHATETPHDVTLTKPFYMGIHEVTNAQWKAVMGSVKSKWKNADHPAEQVSWDDANEFCRRLSALPEEEQAGRVYRLPTEAEWEYACRAGTATMFYFGNDGSQLTAYGWCDGNSQGHTHPVGEKQSNGLGLYDMHGNVWEWCTDWYSVYREEATTDPQGPSSGPGRVLRGGASATTQGTACPRVASGTCRLPRSPT